MSGSISVVVPTFNGATVIVQALESILAQSLKPREIIVVDDKSTDGTISAVERFQARSPLPISLICLAENSGGPARPLNEGIARAAGTLIAINEHDDLMMPNRLAKQLACLERSPQAGLVSCFATIENHEQTQAIGYETSIDLASLSAQPLGDGFFRVAAANVSTAMIRSRQWFLRSLSGCLFPKSIWTAVGGFNPSFRVAADADFLFRVLTKHDLAVVAEPLYRYRLLKNHLALSGKIEGMREYIAIYRRLLRQRCSAGMRYALSARLQAELLNLAYVLRKCRRFAASSAAYGRYLLSGGSGFRAGAGLIKVAIDSALRQFINQTNRHGMRASS